MVKKIQVLLIVISIIGLQASITLADSGITGKDVKKICSRVLLEKVEWFNLIKQLGDEGFDPSPMIDLYTACNELQTALGKHKANPYGKQTELTLAKETALKATKEVMSALEENE